MKGNLLPGESSQSLDGKTTVEISYDEPIIEEFDSSEMDVIST